MFKAERIKKTYDLRFIAPPEKVFPLLCPVREYEWIDGWNCEMIYSESGFAEKDCVFTTRHPGEKEKTVWYMIEQDSENYKAGFLRVTPGSHAVKMQIRLKDNHDGGTDASFAYTCTALSGEGNLAIGHYVEQVLENTTAWLEKSMNNYLRTGQILKRQP